MIDTLKVQKRLVAAGFDQEKAEAITEVIAEQKGNLLTKDHFDIAMNAFNEHIDARFGVFDSRLTGLESKIDSKTGSLREHFDTKIDSLESKFGFQFKIMMAIMLAIFIKSFF